MIDIPFLRNSIGLTIRGYRYFVPTELNANTGEKIYELKITLKPIPNQILVSELCEPLRSLRLKEIQRERSTRTKGPFLPDSIALVELFSLPNPLYVYRIDLWRLI